MIQNLTPDANLNKKPLSLPTRLHINYQLDALIIIYS